MHADAAGDPLAGLFAAPLAGGVIGSPDSAIVVAEWRDPGGGGEPPNYIAPLHVHHDDDEAWYALRVRLGERDVDVPAGGAVLAVRGTPHTYWNPLSEPAHYVLVMTPRIHRLIRALHAPTERSADALAVTFREHRSEYLGWPAR
jgi:mannose-6-phosphate isomerase-like protein (cupin superfamily)